MKYLASALALLFFTTITHAAVHYVDVNATGATPNGSSWATAFPTLQQGVLAAQAAGGGEVWVADGVYTGSMGNPTDTDGVAAGDTVLILPTGVHVYGGFASGEATRGTRDWTANPTIIDGQNIRRGVFTSGIVNGEATLDGFIIRRGHAAEYGGGLYNDQSAPIIANCRFENNRADLKGGGAFSYRAPAQDELGLKAFFRKSNVIRYGLTYRPAFNNVTFTGNTAGYAGGGLYVDNDLTTIEQCSFINNSAGVGGGVYDKGGVSELFRCTFQGNSATDAGAGYCYEGTATTEFTNCQLDHNDAAVAGGAIYSDGYHVSLMHSTVAENSAPQGGGVYGARAYTLALNSIAYDNGASNIDDIASAPLSLLASCIEDATADPAQGVINTDPLFLSPTLGFFGLAAASPAIDTGISGWLKVTDDLNGAPRPQGAEVDMGALEDHIPPVVTDSDNDGLLDAWEIEHFGNLNQNGQGDFDNDGLTNAEEVENQTDPTDADSDNDGHNDGAEVSDGRDPNDPADFPGLVVFADPNLEAAVRLAIGRPSGQILVSYLVGTGFTSLTATSKDIQDLSGLEYCTDLTSVNFNQNLITDLAPLASLPNLTKAYVSSNEVYDLAPLAMNTSITRLFMESNHLSDVSPLAFMSQLTELTLNHNAISNIAPLASLPNLESLSLIQNDITSFAALSGMTSLKSLSVRENAITSIVPVNGLPNIERFDFSYNNVSVIPSGLQLPKLISLHVGGNPLTDYTSISEHSGLRELSIWRTEISDLSPVASLPELTRLTAQDNNITDLTPLAGLTKLEDLNISHNEVVDVTPIGELVRMRLLSISDNEIEDISSLDKLTALESIYAWNNHIGDISVLSHMPNLYSLYLENNRIAELLSLASLMQLRTLDIDFNRVRDVSPLANLPLLQTVGLRVNPIRDIQALVNNPGIGAGDTVNLQSTPLSQVSLCSHVPALTGRGVSVTFTGACGADSDGDDLADAYEAISNTSPTNPDTDGDGLNDGDERSVGTNPSDSDSDNDGILDGTEVASGTDPLNGTSVPSDVYVDSASGDDETGLGTQSAPWATVAHAVASVTGTPENTISIHIAKGVYTHLNAAGGALWLDSHEHLLGGYNAAGWSRDVAANETVLDASVASNGSPAPNVIVMDGIVDVVLDGLTITGAYAPEQGADDSAGILGIDLDDTVLINNCQIVRNRGSIGGSGGLRLFDSSPIITYSTIASNFAFGSGGGILVTGAPSHLVVDRCTISGNQGFGGGIVVGDGATVAITNCRVNGNNAGSWGGGGMSYGGGTGSVIANTTIAHNNANWNSGGGVSVNSGMPLFVNCIFAGNRDYAVLDETPTTGLILQNCLFYGNPEGDYHRFQSITRNGAAAINTLAGASGNVDGDPAFVILQGAWTQAHSYSAATGRTTLVDAQASYTPGALAGMYLALFPSFPEAQLRVHSNTATTIEVVGQVSNSIGAGSAYSVIDYHLQPGSAAIDMGIDTSAPEDGGVTTDFDGVARGFDGDGQGATTADGSDYDIGVFESDVSLTPTITVQSPNGGEVASRGTYVNITWASSGDLGADVKISARRLGLAFNGTVAATTPNDGHFEWFVPANYPLANNFVIEIASVSTPTIFDQSDAAFTINAGPTVAGTLTVLSPNGGEYALRGSQFPIQWSHTGYIGGAVKIVLRRGTSVFVVTNNTMNDGTFEWTVPNYGIASNYRIEISSVVAPAIVDQSDGDFSLTDTPLPPPSISVTAPNGGESYAPGGTVPVTWTSTGATGSAVQILVHGAGQTVTLAESTANDGAFDWTIPAGQAPAADYTIEVRSISAPAAGDTSNAPFAIQFPTATVTVLSPNGGETASRGTYVNINWNTTGNAGAEVKIAARRLGLAFNGTVATTTPNDGHFEWFVPANYPLGTNFVIEVSSIANPTLLDTSDAPFTIDAGPTVAGTLTVLSPNGGESVQRGAVYPIQWSNTGYIGGAVKIILRRGTSTFVVTNNTANDGAFEWTVPTYGIASNYRIEISSVAAPAILDQSDGDFSLTDTPPPAGSIAVTAPNGGESVLQGASQPITWTSSGDVGTNVRILLHGAGQSVTLAEATPNDGSFDWIVPAAQAPGTDYTIEVRSTTVPTAGDTSNAPFSIQAPVAAITVLAPNGGETISRGTYVNITWNSAGNVGTDVKIVARRVGLSFNGTVAATTPNDGHFEWFVPASYPLATNFVIDISSIADPAIVDTSDATFTIDAGPAVAGTLTVLSPNGGESVQRGGQSTIQWSHTGYIGGAVKIILRRGTSTFIVTNNTPNDGTFEWDVPTYGVASNYRIEISSVVAPAILDQSDGDFSFIN